VIPVAPVSVAGLELRPGASRDGHHVARLVERQPVPPSARDHVGVAAVEVLVDGLLRGRAD
jgi:hypothetical protein